LDVSEQVEKLVEGDTLVINGTRRVFLLRKWGRKLMLRENGDVTSSVVYNAATDRWWYGISGHEDLLVTSLSRVRR
jgi:hypothetical protein